MYQLKTYSETLATGEALEKEVRIFGSEGARYTSAEEADQHMTSVTVPVWQIDDSGSLYSTTLTFRINSILAADVEAIFNEIYTSPTMPPIKGR